MKYYDYDWSLHKDRIILDRGINIDQLGWKGGDLFKLVNIDGQPMLIKIETPDNIVKGYN